MKAQGKAFKCAFTTVLLGSASLAVASPVFAQDQATPAEDAGASEETIIVTGSRIRRDPLDQAAPIVTLDEGAIEDTGLSSVADILQRLPSAGGGLNSRFNNSGNFGNPPDGGGVGAGSAEVDLRYLGAARARARRRPALGAQRLVGVRRPGARPT